MAWKHLESLKYKLKKLLRMNTDDDDLLCTVYLCTGCRGVTTQVHGDPLPLSCKSCRQKFHHPA